GGGKRGTRGSGGGKERDLRRGRKRGGRRQLLRGPAALNTAPPSRLGESRSCAPAALRMQGSLASVHEERGAGGEDGGGLSHFRRNSPPSATPVVAQNRNIHLSSSLFSSASFTSSWCQRPSHFASDSARRCSSLASNRAKLRSFRSRRSARCVASTALNQFTSSFVMSCRKSLLGAGAESRV